MLNKATYFNNLALYLYCFSLSMESLHFFYFGGTYSFAFISAVVFFISSIFCFKDYLNIKKTMYFVLPILLYLGVLIISSLLNINEISNRFLDEKLILNMVMFHMLIIAMSKNKQTRDTAFFVFTIGVLVVVSLAFFGIGVEYNSDDRLSWMLSSRDEYPLRVSAALVILLTLIFSKRRFELKNIWIFLSTPLFIWFVLETGSRTATIVIFFILILSLYFQRRNWQNILILFLIGFIPYFVIYLFAEALNSRFVYTVSEISQHIFSEEKVLKSNNDALGGRLYGWSKMMPMFYESPLIGQGLSGFDLKLLELIPERPNDSPHNALFDALFKTGFIGLSIYLLFVFRLSFAAYNNLIQKKESQHILFFIILFFGYILTLHPNHDKGFWFISAYLVCSFLENNLSKSKYRFN